MIRKRKAQALQPFFLLANLMDPSRMGSELSQEDEEAAEEWIELNKEEFLVGFLAFKIKDETYFPKVMFSSKILDAYKGTPAKWWTLMERRTEKASTLPTDFCPFFCSLFSCPPSSAAIERIFSSFSIVWTKLRNRLGSEKAGKLVQVHKYLRSHSEKRMTDVRDVDSDNDW